MVASVIAYAGVCLVHHNDGDLNFHQFWAELTLCFMTSTLWNQTSSNRAQAPFLSTVGDAGAM